jgi:hypothetical protein
MSTIASRRRRNRATRWAIHWLSPVIAPIWALAIGLGRLFSLIPQLFPETRHDGYR